MKVCLNIFSSQKAGLKVWSGFPLCLYRCPGDARTSKAGFSSFGFIKLLNQLKLCPSDLLDDQLRDLVRSSDLEKSVRILVE